MPVEDILSQNYKKTTLRFSESKGDEKDVPEMNGTLRALKNSPCGLLREPTVPFAAGFLRLIFSLSERLFSASVQTEVYQPWQQSKSPRRLAESPGTLGNPGC